MFFSDPFQMLDKGTQHIISQFDHLSFCNNNNIIDTPISHAPIHSTTTPTMGGEIDTDTNSFISLLSAGAAYTLKLAFSPSNAINN